MDESMQQKVALFRYALIAPILNETYTQSTAKEYLASVCSKTYDVPYYGKREFSPVMDNGKVFRSDQLQYICASLGTIVSYALHILRLATTVNDYASKDIDRCIHKLETYMNRIYHPDLRSIRQEASLLYKAYLAVRDIDKSTAGKLYSQYLDKKYKAARLEKQLSSREF